jgi:hypothetical protein
MKKYLLVLVIILAFTTTINAQDDKTSLEKTSQAVYNGFDGKSYSFTTVAENPLDSIELSFSEVGIETLSQFDLKSDTLIDQTFTVTYTVETEIIETAEGVEEEVIAYKLVGIKK